MVLNVSDTASNRRDQIANYAELLRNSPAKQKLFSAVYQDKRKTKTISQIAHRLGWTAKRVATVAKPLARGEKLFEQDRENIDGKVQTVYRKLDFVQANKKKILQLANGKKKLDAYHTKTNPRNLHSNRPRITIQVPFSVRTKFVRIDEVDQFSRVRKIKKIPANLVPERLSEKAVKLGILKLLKEAKIPKDWGGESNDIFTTKLSLNGRSLRGAFALKGPAKHGPLVPGMMGKNGDQIQRLFDSPADVFFRAI